MDVARIDVREAKAREELLKHVSAREAREALLKGAKQEDKQQPKKAE